MSESTAVSKLENFAITQQDMSSVLDIIRENVGDAEITHADLDKVKIPTGGRTKWDIPTLGGEETNENLQGVIVHWRSPRAYWDKPFDESGGEDIPACYSDDGKIGVAEDDSSVDWAGGIRECATCPFNEWGSGKGKGKACKQMRLLFVLREDSLLPVTVTLPPTSIKPSKKYFLRLASRGIPYHGVLTNITLSEAKNEQGIKYSVAEFSMEKQLALEQAQFIENYRDMIKNELDSVRVEASDVSEESL